jgi:hypothetical protein
VNNVVATVLPPSVAVIVFEPRRPARLLFGIVAWQEKVPSAVVTAVHRVVVARFGRFRPEL